MMKLILSEIPKKLNKAYLKQDLTREQVETFKLNLKTLFTKAELAVNKNEHEEHFKNIVSDFLKDTWYKNKYEININKRKDLVIHNGKSSSDSIGVIIEAKKPSNEAEMISEKNPNSKALHELIHYFLQERIFNNNKEIKHLVATNGYDWYIFDAAGFEKYFFENKEIRKEYEDWHSKASLGSNTDWFYNQVAKPYVESKLPELEAVHFNLLDYKETVENEKPEDDDSLINLYKILSPEHLLKKPFANDSNTLNKEFYNELLYIIGLEERPEGGKKLIDRKKPENRNDGSLLENAINILKTRRILNSFHNPQQFGPTEDDQLYNIGLELCITWLNRILFLKLLEGQLIKYHGGDQAYAFINSKNIFDFDELDELFFEVLAINTNERTPSVNEKFGNIPYLNSSLFETSHLEDWTIQVSDLKDRLKLPIFNHSVLKNKEENKDLCQKYTLHYLFEFLAAYNFSSDSSAKIQEDNKTIINASVLGLIFEKINGYKDGSFFTPGFITMYMCRETIRRAVAQKFKELENNEIETFDDVKKYCSRYFKNEDITRFNNHINSLKICDPAVGSGHFLVSALNEIIAIKSELNILTDTEGTPLEYEISVDNDELTIINKRTNKPFEYIMGADNKPPKAMQQVQVSLFREKQTIIENCLFGVDINPKSVLICRLRLWIELLKNAYYKFPFPIVDTHGRAYLQSEIRSELELETLPNIDINIKCGNSLISRFPLVEAQGLAPLLKSIKYDINTYRKCVADYKNATNKDDKHALYDLINTIKKDFRDQINTNDPKYIRLNKVKGELLALTSQHQLFELTEAQKQEFRNKAEKLAVEQNKLEQEIADIRDNAIYRNAFEWRFEFPEVLDDAGNFLGFDVVIGNPPYIRQEEISNFKSYLQERYPSYAGTADLYVYFIDLGTLILGNNGNFTFILPNKWMRSGYGKSLRNNILKQRIEFILDFGDLPVFEEATTYPCILSFSNNKPKENFVATNIKTLEFTKGLSANVEENRIIIDINELNDSGWSLNDSKVQKLLGKLRNIGIPLREYANDKIYRGVLTGLNEAFVLSAEKRDELIEKDANSASLIKPFLAGKDIKRYTQPQNKDWLIMIPKGFTIKKNLPKSNPNHLEEPMPRYGYMDENVAWKWFSNNYPALAEHLLQFKDKAEKRTDKGDFWWELRACDYYDEFEKIKIIYPNICKQPEFTIDEAGVYTNQKCFIIINSEPFLLGILNSKLFFFLFKMILPKLRGDFYEPSYVYFKDFPIPIIKPKEKQKIDSVVRQILDSKKQNPNSDTTHLEKEIDQLVYQLYGLTDEEIAIVEGA